MADVPHRCNDCLDELPEGVARFLVFVWHGRSWSFPGWWEEKVVGACCVGWYAGRYPEPVLVSLDEARNSHEPEELDDFAGLTC